MKLLQCSECNSKKVQYYSTTEAIKCPDCGAILKKARAHMDEHELGRDLLGMPPISRMEGLWRTFLFVFVIVPLTFLVVFILGYLELI
ncbi:hypothetical protein ACFL35_06045 [Candidatus Riflebacteria bacterium]